MFAEHQSESVQHTLYRDGAGRARHHPAEVAAIRLVMPNRHHLPVDLSRFGLENRNEIFVATEEPHGLIEATIARAAGCRCSVAQLSVVRVLAVSNGRPLVVTDACPADDWKLR